MFAVPSGIGGLTDKTPVLSGNKKAEGMTMLRVSIYGDERAGGNEISASYALTGGQGPDFWITGHDKHGNEIVCFLSIRQARAIHARLGAFLDSKEVADVESV